MMMNSTAILAGIIASSIVLGGAPSVDTNTLLAFYFDVPDREDGIGGSTIQLGDYVWHDPNEKPAGFTGGSAFVGGPYSGAFSAMTVPAADTSLYLNAYDFTVECFIKSNGVPTANQYIIGNYYASGSYRRYWMSINYSNRRIEFGVYTTGNLTAMFTIGSGGWNAFWEAGWHHIAAQRNDTSITIYVDGVAGATVATIGTGVSINTNNTMAFTMFTQAYSRGSYFRGWIDELRITRGLRYTSFPFTPPSTNFPRGGSDPMWSDTVMLAGFDNKFGFIKKGQAGIIHTASAFSGSNNLSSWYREGIPGNATTENMIAMSDKLELGSDDFTIEIVLYAASTSNSTRITTNPSTNPPMSMGYSSSYTNNHFSIQLKDASNVELMHDAVLMTPLGEYRTVTLVRQGTTYYMYRDGVLENTGSLVGSLASFIDKSLNLMTKNNSNHYLKAMRICKTALYTGSTYTLTDYHDWLDEDFWSTVWAATAFSTATYASYTNYTSRHYIQFSKLKEDAPYLRFTFRAGDSGMTIDQATFGIGAASGGGLAATPLAVTFGGAAGITVGANGIITTDPIEVPTHLLTDYMNLSFYVSAGNLMKITAPTTEIRNMKYSGNQVNTLTSAGWANDGTVTNCVQMIEGIYELP